MENQYFSQTIQQARFNAESAKKFTSEAGKQLSMYPGIIKTVNAGENSYKVAAIGSDGVTELAVYDAVIVLGANIEYAEDEVVVLVFTTKEYPYILSTGGGGGNCGVNVNQFGVLWG